MDPLRSSDIDAALGDLPGWSFEEDCLVRQYSFADFQVALAFLVRFGFVCEAMDHHAEITNLYRSVRLRLNTHEAGGKVTAKDVALAARAESIAEGML